MCGNKNVVVIPVHKETLTVDEQMSLRQCASVLKSHPICIVCPQGLNVAVYTKTLSDNGATCFIERFSARFFDGIKGYNLLMLDKSFYKRFANYEYMLIYQLDAWVFRDELDEWCEKSYDYIGAPWIEENEKGELVFAGVGNGGFSLRRVQHFIDVLSHRGPVRKAKQLNLKPTLKNKTYSIFYSLGYQNTISYYKKDETLYEDIFLSIFLANTKLKANMPSSEEACHFAFEKQPSYLYSATGQLPFGCHAWRKYEYNTFWVNHITIPV
ncbi:MAG: hypothetical protein J6X58_03290 [Bacteroidales bacterium]|nr:hypothetical protein [Bacteroidales bacterium]